MSKEKGVNAEWGYQLHMSRFGLHLTLFGYGVSTAAFNYEAFDGWDVFLIVLGLFGAFASYHCFFSLPKKVIRSSGKARYAAHVAPGSLALAASFLFGNMLFAICAASMFVFSLFGFFFADPALFEANTEKEGD